MRLSARKPSNKRLKRMLVFGQHTTIADVWNYRLIAVRSFQSETAPAEEITRPAMYFRLGIFCDNNTDPNLNKPCKSNIIEHMHVMCPNKRPYL